MALDLGAPGLDVVDVLEAVDRLAVGKQLAVVVAAVDTRDLGISRREAGRAADPRVDRVLAEAREVQRPIACELRTMKACGPGWSALHPNQPAWAFWPGREIASSACTTIARRPCASTAWRVSSAPAASSR